MHTGTQRTAALLVLWAAALFDLHPSSGLAQAPLGESESLLNALREGEGSVQLRYRLETVDQDGIDDRAWASTLRTALRYQTRQYRDFDLFLETTNVANIGHDAYNSTANGHTQYPVVADPSLTRMNQSFLRWTGPSAMGTLGRQELVYDNARFVGNVGWRQTHQTFDAVRADWSPTDRVDVRYTYMDRVHRIDDRRLDLQGHLVNLGLDVGRFGHLAGYAYLLDFDDDAAFALSTNTFGGFWTGTRKLASGPWSIDWRAEYASQRDAYDNPGRIRADYMHFVAGLGRPEIAFHVGWESLSGNADDGPFRTVFATGHKFNGWADKFLATPDDGLRDLYVTASGKWNRVGYEATWHDFSSETGGIDYASELDAQVNYTTSWDQKLALKAAFYSADAFATDTTKVWAYTTFNF